MFCILFLFKMFITFVAGNKLNNETMEQKRLWVNKKRGMKIDKMRDRMWRFIIASGMEDRFADFCETGEADDLESKYIDRCLFIELSGLSEDFREYKKCCGDVVNYKKVASIAQEGYSHLMDSYLKQAEYIITLQNKIIEMTEKQKLPKSKNRPRTVLEI